MLKKVKTKKRIVKKLSPTMKKRLGLSFYNKKDSVKIDKKIKNRQENLSVSNESKVSSKVDRTLLNSFVNKNSGFKRSRIVTILRDTEWAFSYWEIGGEQFNSVKNSIESQNLHITNNVLRVVNCDNSDYYDIDVDAFASSWYFSPNMPGHEIMVELGVRLNDGSYRKIVESNKIILPDKIENNNRNINGNGQILWSDPATGNVEPGYMENEDVIIEALGGEKYIKTIVGSNEFLRSLKEMLYSGTLLSSEVFAKLVSSLVSSIISSGLSSSFTSFGQHEDYINKTNIKKVTGEEGDDFWMVVGTELILYGATEPDADLRVAGQKIPLKKDGTFFLRMPLPDKTIELPVEAFSKNGKHYRKVIPIVKKWTE